MFKATQILLNNPNFRCKLDTEGNVTSLMCLVWDFNESSRDGFIYDSSTSLPAFYKLKQIDAENDGDGWRWGEFSNFDLVNSQKLLPEPRMQRLTMVREEFISHMYSVDFKIEYSGSDMKAAQIWAHILPYGPYKDHFISAITTQKGARTALRYLNSGHLSERKIDSVISVDFVVHQIAESSTPSTEQKKREPKHAISTLNEFYPAVFPEHELPEGVKVWEQWFTDESAVSFLVKRELQPCPELDFPEVELFTDMSERDMVLAAYKEKSILKAIANATATVVRDEVIEKFTYQDIYDYLVSVGGDTETISDAVEKQMIKHYRYNSGAWDVFDKYPLWIVGEYSDIHKFLNESAEASGNLSDVYDVKIMPMSDTGGAIYAIMSYPDLPFGVTLKAKDRTALQAKTITRMIWKF